jgi:hypothetical protein
MIKNNISANKVGNLLVIPEDAINELLENQKTIMSVISNDENSSSGIGDWIPEKEAQRILGRKTTTMYNLRSTGRIETTKFGSKVFYSKSSILKFLEANKKGG